MGMGGSTAGGSTSGTVDYPDYMKEYHEYFLEVVWDIVQTEVGTSSPYASFSLVDPNFTFGVGGGWQSPTTAMSALDGLVLYTQFNTTASNVAAFSDNISAAASAFGTIQDNRFTAQVQPRFEAGMLNIGAALSSAFVLGRAIFEDANQDKVDAFTEKMEADKLRFSWNVALQLTLSHLEKERLVAALAAEIARMYTAARFEVDIARINFSARDRQWDLEVLQYAANVLASISGAAVARQSEHQSSTLGGAMSGALAGAAAGAAVGGPWGAAIGGGLGLLSSLFS